MRDILNTYTVQELKQMISSTNIKGYNKLKKAELIDLMLRPEHIGRFKHLKGKGKDVPMVQDKAGQTPRTQWMASRMALDLANAFPRESSVASVAWTVAQGKKLRPAYAEGSDVYDQALDFIADNYQV